MRLSKGFSMSAEKAALPSDRCPPRREGTRLEGRGLVERVRDRVDGRNRIIRLTAEGERTWDEMQGGIELFYVKARSSP